MHVSSVSDLSKSFLNQKVIKIIVFSQCFCTYRKFHHDDILKIYGICYTLNEEDPGRTENDKRLTMVLEYCESSLEEFVFKDVTLQCR